MRYSKLFSIISGLTLALVVTAADAKLYVVANKDLGIKHLTAAQLANLYMGRPMGVDTKVAPVAIDHEPGSPQYKEFYHHILH